MLSRVHRPECGYVRVRGTLGREGFVMSETLPGRSEPFDEGELVDLVPLLRRVVGSRVKDAVIVEDLVQESLARVLAARDRVAPDRLPHYASVTARNLVASMAERNDRARARAHLLVEAPNDESAADGVLLGDERRMIRSALAHLPSADRDLLLAHEVEGEDTRTMAEDRGSTAGAVAARLSRARASLRVEYLLAAEGVEPPTDRCRPVLRAISSGDRRRQRELDVHRHLLECATCSHIRSELGKRRVEQPEDGVVRVPVERAADVVAARQRGREVAARVGFSSADQTVIATAISEIARNIVRFAERGEVTISSLGSAGGRGGIRVVARDVGPGIDDPELALEDGYSTSFGLGLGLPGARRLMDTLDLDSTPGEGTTVAMEKWLA